MGKHRLLLPLSTPSRAHGSDQHLNNRTIVTAAADTAGLERGCGAGFEVRPIKC